MPFDPDAFLKAPASGEFDPDAFLAQGTGPTAGFEDFDIDAMAAARGPGALESYGRAALQGATLGWSDEIGGLGAAMFGGANVDDWVNENRANNRAAQEANPNAYLAGEVSGGLATALVPVPGAGAAGAARATGTIGRLAARGARATGTIGRLAARGAAEGAIAGAGYSEADSLGGVIQDAGKGALLGGAVGGGAGAALGATAKGLRRLAKRWPEKVENRIGREITMGSEQKPIKALIGKDGSGQRKLGKMVLLDDELLAVHKDPVKLLAVAERKIDDIGKQLDTIYPAVDNVSAGLEVAAVRKSFDEVADAARKDYSPTIAKAIEKRRDDILREMTGAVAVEADDMAKASAAALKEIGQGQKKLVTKAIKFQLDEITDQAKSYAATRGTLTVDDVARIADDVASAAGKKMPVGYAEELADAIKNLSARLVSKRKISAQEMRKTTRRLQKDGFAGADVTNLDEMRSAAADVGGRLRETLNQHVEAVAKSADMPELSSIRELNGREADMIKIWDVTAPKARKALNGTPSRQPMSMTSLQKMASNPAMAATAAAIDPSGLGGLNLAYQVARGAADKGQETIAKAAARGGDVAGAVQRAAFKGAKAASSGATRAAAGGTQRARRDAAVSRIEQMAARGVRPDEILVSASKMGIPMAEARAIIARGRAVQRSPGLAAGT